MSPENHQRVRQLFDEAMERPEGERTVFLHTACGGDLELFRQVSQLLAAHAQVDSFLEKEPVRPQRIGRYLIKGELGRGAMGIVYDATDPLIGRRVAVKVIRLGTLVDGTEAAFLRERLFREARSAGSLFHPGIVVILDVGQDRDVAFIAMECVEGPSLYQVMAKQGRLELAESLRILKEIAAALDFAHAHGVVHRDIKPANVMLDKGVAVKVADFGIAKITSSTQFAQTTTAMGTPSYMSPEQMDAKPLDGKADQFSLAVVAYELLTGSKPFMAESLSGLAHTVVYGNRPSAHAANPELPAAVDDVLKRGLARLPEERFATCGELVEALEQALSGRSEAAAVPPISVLPPEEATHVTWRPPPVPPPAPEKPGESRRYLVAGAIGVVLLVGAGVAYKLVSGGRMATPSSAQHESKPPTPAPLSGGTPSAPQQEKKAPDQPSGVKTPYDKPPETKRTEATLKVDPHQIFVAGQSKMADNQTEDGLALLRKAADLGETHAMVKLGEYALKDVPGHLPDEEQALSWFRKAAAAGDPEGMLHLGVAYDLGNGVDEDDAQAAVWYRKAADAGNADAAYNLAKKYEKGQGVPKDLTQACALYERAAKRGNADAKAKLDSTCGH